MKQIDWRQYFQKQTRSVAAIAVAITAFGCGLLPFVLLRNCGKSHRLQMNAQDDSTPNQAKALIEQNSERPLVIGFIPSTNIETLRRDSEETTRDLSQLMTHPVRGFIGTSYNNVVEQLKEKKLDGAFLTAVVYARNLAAEEIVPVLQVTRNGQWPDRYFSAIITQKDRLDLTSLKELCGKRIGYVDIDSASGYIYAKHRILQAISHNETPNCQLGTENFFGGHEQVLKALERREIDAGAVFADRIDGTSGAWTQLGSYDIQVLGYSEPIPSDGFFIRNDLDPVMREKLTTALIHLAERRSPPSPLARMLNTHQFIKTKPEDYFGVARVLSEIQRLDRMNRENHHKK